MGFTKKDINKSYVLTFLNYRYSDKSIILEDFNISDGRMYNDEHTVNIEPITNKFIPFTLTEAYYKDVVLHITSFERNDKIDNIIKKET